MSTTEQTLELRCSKCGAYKDETAFYRRNNDDSRKRNGRASECKACAQERGRLKRAGETARRALPPGVTGCMRAYCTNPATEELTNGNFLKPLTLSHAGALALRNGAAAPLCARCHAEATR